MLVWPSLWFARFLHLGLHVWGQARATCCPRATQGTGEPRGKDRRTVGSHWNVGQHRVHHFLWWVAVGLQLEMEIPNNGGNYWSIHVKKTVI
jgi:hypothetical protein